MDCLSVTSVLVAAIVLLCIYTIWNILDGFKVFKKLGIDGPEPSILGGNARQCLKEGLCSSLIEFRKKYGKVYGLYFPYEPALIVQDLDMLQDIFIKKFYNFCNRYPQGQLQTEPWSDTLLALKDDHWKHVRSQLSPTFSSGKLKKMLPSMDRVLDNMIEYVNKQAAGSENVELKELFACYTMDCTAATTFGYHVDSLKDKDNVFFKEGNALLKPPKFLQFFIMISPRILPYLNKIGISITPKRPLNFFMDIVKQALKERRQDNKVYGDFLQLLVDAEREESEVKGQVDKEIDHSDQLNISSKWTKKGLDDNEKLSNALLFIIAGFENNATVACNTFFYLVNNPDILKKAHEEVDSKLGKTRVTYDTANNLTYIDMCIQETMRMYPPGFITDRETAADIQLGSYNIPKGMRIMIPVHAIHHDPEYWPDPYTFDPERHTQEKKVNRHPCAFLPFGVGPRNCIGMRLAQLEIRMGIATLLQHFNPKPCDKTVFPPVHEHPQMRMKFKDGAWIKFEAR